MTQINIQGTDIANRVRRFTKAVGAVPSVLDDKLHLDLDVGDLTRDPYQSEWHSFVGQAQGTTVAAQNSIAGIVGNAPVTVVYAINILAPAAGGKVQLLIQRPETTSVGGVFNSSILAPLNGGGNNINILAQCQAAVVQTSGAGPSGQTMDFVTIDTVRSVLWVPPDPIVLYGPPFNGQRAGSGIGDALLVVNQTVNQPQFASFYFREYPNFTPN